MAGPDTTAQVHPKKLSEALVAGAQELGATLRMGEVQGVKHDGHRVQGRWSHSQQCPEDKCARRRTERKKDNCMSMQQVAAKFSTGGDGS